MGLEPPNGPLLCLLVGEDHPAAMAVIGTVGAEEFELAKPQLLLREADEGMPTGQTEEVRVLTATIDPGSKTPFHTHRLPVTVVILDGAFPLEMEGTPP